MTAFIFSFIYSSPSRTSSSGDESFQDSLLQKTQPRSQEEFFKRVGTFEPGLWTVDPISPLVCASWGWKLIEKDVLQCVSCHEVICASLPSKKHRVACKFSKYFLHSFFEVEIPI